VELYALAVVIIVVGWLVDRGRGITLDR
jgi:hypothetical protein